MEPSRGEVSAIVGFGGQFDLAARIVIAKLSTLEWIRVADPEAGVADDFQFKSGARRYALQVKWSQFPGSFTWTDLTKGEKAKNGRSAKAGLLTRLATAWEKIHAASTDPLTVYLCTNNLPSTTSATSGPLSQATAAPPRSLAHFIARSFEPIRNAISERDLDWSELVALEEYKDWETVWDAIRELVRLGDTDFVSFVAALQMTFGIGPAEPLLLPDQNPAESNVGHLAHTLQNIVREVARPDQLSREQLLARLGWSDSVRYRHPHLFPVPAVYSANASACTALEQRLVDLSGGYLALVGPAGSGKSTLLASLKPHGHIVRYYAFVPDAADPLSGRGEAESWMHDVSLALEDSGLPRKGIGNDLRSRQTILLDQLNRAGQRWARSSERTVIVIDGLDHIPREQNPTRSLIDELPSPTAIPDGVYLVLGTQTTVILPTPVRVVIECPDRTVNLPPLSAEESERLIELTGVGSWMYGDQIAQAVEAGEGHPLALTYLLQELVGLADEVSEPDARRDAADRVVADASSYGGDIGARYRGYFEVVGSDERLIDLLGVVARLRVPVNLKWLATWADPQVVTMFAGRAAVFFRQVDADWRFIHNSFRRFLENETACVAGRHDAARDRQLHERLAEICAASTDEWRSYRDEEMVHRYLAGQHERVLQLAEPEKLRGSLGNLRPIETVRSHALLAFRSAAVLDEASAFVPLLVFLNDLWVREYVLEPAALAEALVTVDLQGALEHIVRGGRLRVAPKAAMRLSVKYAHRGDAVAVQTIVRACGGLRGILDGHDFQTDQVVADWASAVWHISGTEAVLAELDHQVPPPIRPAVMPEDRGGEMMGDSHCAQSDSPAGDNSNSNSDDGDDETDENCRNIVHAMCFDEVAQLRDDEVLDRLTELIDSEGNADWRARARLRRATVASEDRAPARVLELIREIIAIDAGSPPGEEDDDCGTGGAANHAVLLSIRVAAAELLVRNGFSDGAEIDQILPPGSAPRWPSSVEGIGRDGLRPFKTMMIFNRVRQVKPDPSRQNLCSPNTPPFEDAGRERLRRALGRLAELEGQQLKADLGLAEPPAVAALAGPILRLFEVPRNNRNQRMGMSLASEIGRDLYERLIELATEAGGIDELKRLLEAFDSAWNHPQRSAYWSLEQRQHVTIAALKAHPETKSWALLWLERFEADLESRPHEPYGQSTCYLTQARAWAAAGRGDNARHCAQRAVTAAVGIGIHDHDEQLVEWVKWLAVATDAEQLSSVQFAAAVHKYAARIAAIAPNASAHAHSASEQLIALAFSRNPALGCEIAEWLCDAETLSETAMIQAVVLAACTHPDIPILDGANLAANMLYPLAFEPTSMIGQTVLSRSEPHTSPIAVLENAERIWTVGRPGSWSWASEPEVQRSQQDSPGTLATDSRVETVGGLLSYLRNAVSVEDSPSGGWDETLDRVASSETVSPMMARAFIEQASRIGLNGAALGSLVALAARSGEPDAATRALANELARLPGSRWRRQADGGSRLKLLKAALRDRDPRLVQLARQDLATSLASGALEGALAPDDIFRITSVVAGPGTIETAWPQIDAYLSETIVITPLRQDCRQVSIPCYASGAVEAIANWVARYYGHPIRPLDFGARRTLQSLHHRHTDAVQPVLAAAIIRGGWSCEAALLTLVTTPVDERIREISISEELISALNDAAVGKDGICRDLAGRVGAMYSVPLDEPARRPLSASYLLSLPPLRPRTVAEVDSEGTPHLDKNDPRQLLAPYDEALIMLADEASLGVATVLHHASGFADASGDRWIRDGHHGLGSQLKRRQQSYAYRPWAYMAGRRAMGLVLAELADAGRIDRNPRVPWSYRLGLIDERLAGFPVGPMPENVPRPWRPEEPRRYYSDDWCETIEQASDAYGEIYSSNAPYLLAEYSEWRVLDWSLPVEQRLLHTRYSPFVGSLLAPDMPPWEAFFGGSYAYPYQPLRKWDKELVVRVYEGLTDGARMQWIALHPAVGTRLGWQHDHQNLFAWNGADGEWRARTVMFARGHLWHQPSQEEVCGEVWQVQLSDAGYEELKTAFPSLRRELVVERQIPASPRNGRMEAEVRTCRALLQG